MVKAAPLALLHYHLDEFGSRIFDFGVDHHWREKIFERGPGGFGPFIRIERSFAARAFTPSFRFNRRFAVGPELLCPWPELEEWIPGRVTAIMEALRDGIAID